MLRRRIVRLIDDHVVERCAGELLMHTCRREVHVARDVIARFDQQLRQNVLGAASLVCRNDFGVAIKGLDSVLEVVVVARSGVRLVAEHDSGPLTVGHRAVARVGEQVDVDVLRTEQEGVESGLACRGFAFDSRQYANRLDDLDLPRLRPTLSTHRLPRAVIAESSAEGAVFQSGNVSVMREDFADNRRGFGKRQSRRRIRSATTGR